jgi:hypothetical protein
MVQTPERRNAPLTAHDTAHDKARVETHFEAIPRIVTPEGNILRVGTGNAQATVGH